MICVINGAKRYLSLISYLREGTSLVCNSDLYSITSDKTMLFTRDGCNGVSICNNGFDWLNSNKLFAVFHTEAYRWAQKSVFLVGLKLILVGLKLILVPLKIILVGLKIILVGLKLILVPLKLILVGLKLFLVGLKLFLVPLILFLVALKLFLVPLKIQTFEPNGTPYKTVFLESLSF